MNIAPFELAVATFEHAREFDVQVDWLAPFSPVDNLISEIRCWFRHLQDADSEHATALRIHVWKLRIAALYSLVAFDDPALGIRDLHSVIAVRGQYFPGLRDRCERLSRLVDTLVGQSINPKREAVHAELARWADGGRTVGLVVALARNHFPAFSETFINDFESIGHEIQFIASRRQLLASTFNHLVIPFGTKQCALANEILHGYRAPGATVIAYPFEAMAPRTKRTLPCAIAVDGRPPGVNRPHISPEPTEVDESLDESVFWSAIKQSEAVQIEVREPDTTYLVPARGILLANGAHVFLRDDLKVIEISDLVERRTSLDDFGRHFPRTPVRQLQPGDLIVLRVKGSGEYLIEVADDLMRKEGKAKLRANAINWKPILKSVLAQKGSKWFLQQLEKRKFHLASHSYLWKWTTEEVISPQSESHFYETIAILDDLGQMLGERDVLEAAKKRWERMKELKRYHRKAAQKIRQELLRRLRAVIKEHLQIGSEYALEIPGVSAGTMAIVRIAAVDAEVVSIPYHRTGLVSDANTPGIGGPRLNDL